LKAIDFILARGAEQSPRNCGEALGMDERVTLHTFTEQPSMEPPQNKLDLL
jgi:hypothetical protein